MFNGRYDTAERSSKSWDDLSAIEQVPCRSEFLKYLQWHNLAFEVQDIWATPVLVLHFESLMDGTHEALDSLLKFIELERDLTRFPARVVARPYRNYFTTSEALLVKQFFQKVASSQTWQQTEHYFSAANLELHDTAGGGTVAVASQTEPSPAPPPVLVPATELKVVMFMSFPNSGTSFTTQLIRSATGFQTASNYATESHGTPVPVFQELPGGPFWTAGAEDLKLLPRGYLMTKTHCGGYCMSCPPSQYAFTKIDAFLESCVTTIGASREEPRSQYNFALVHKVVHIFRDPFDNVVARFHLDYNQAAKRHETLGYPSNSSGFRKYCADLNAKYEAEEIASPSWSESVKKVSKDVPCRADFFRYVQWHNYAVMMVDTHHLPSLILHYENYISKLDSVLDTLLTFLELKRDASRVPAPFTPGHTYRGYYTDKEVASLKEMFKLMASPVVWSQVAHYFP